MRIRRFKQVVPTDDVGSAILTGASSFYIQLVM
jgi:hypothetical protein